MVRSLRSTCSKSGLSTSRDISAVDRQAGTGNEAGSGAGEISDQPSDLFRLAHASEWHEGFHHLDVTSCHVGGCGTGLNVVYGNPARGEIDRHSANQGRNGALGHRIDAGPRKGGPDGCVAADGYDSSAVGEMGGGRLDRDKDAANIRRQHKVEIFKGKR